MSNCPHVISQLEAFGWGAFGSVLAFAWIRTFPRVRAVVVTAGGRKIADQLRSGEIDTVALALLLLLLVGVGVFAALVGEPTSWKDAAVWGVAGQGLLSGLVPGE
jgi:hypothetical protein